MFISTYLVTDLPCRGLGFHRPDFRRQGLALLQILLKLVRHTAYQQPGFVLYGSKQDFSLKRGCFAQVLRQQYHTAEANIGISNQDEIRKSYN